MPPPGKPDIDPPLVKILEPVNNDTLKDTIINVIYSYKDKSRASEITLFFNNIQVLKDTELKDSNEFIDTLITYLKPSKVDTLNRVFIKARDKWDNIFKTPVIKLWFIKGREKR